MPVSVEATAGVVEMIHGVPVADPYRWLEDRDSRDTEGWLINQRQRFNDYIHALGRSEVLRSRVQEYLGIETIDQIGAVQGRYFYRKRRVGDQQPSIFVMDAITKIESLLVNPALLAAFTSVGIHRVSACGRYLAYELKHGGEHSCAIHVLDVSTGEIFPEFLQRGRARGFAFRGASDGYYYCHETIEEGTADSRDEHLIRFHRFGADTRVDEIILRVPGTPTSKLVLRSDGMLLWAALFDKPRNRYSVSFYVAKQHQHQAWRCVAQNVATPFNPISCRQSLVVAKYDEAANGEIVELDPTTWRPARVIVSQWDAPITDLTVARDHLYVSYMAESDAVIREWSFDGRFLGEIPLEKGCSWTVLPPYSTEADEFFLRCESFSKPPTLYHYNTSTGRRSVWGQHRVPPPKFSITHHRLSYPGKDGVAISISLVGNSDLGLRGRPVIMTAYGGFGVTSPPQFSAFISVMMELGFLFAFPEIRGGGERGPEWHDAARRRNRQVSIDDFLAAAEWLVAEGITSSERLGIFGGSNSGLLVGAAITQRPQQFGAAFCIAPLLDMVRYHLFDRAYVWDEEYGCADDPDDFRVLYSYSPYHRVDEEQNYPPILFVSGDQDTRCNPAHTRKMAARLQDRIAQTHPVLLDYSRARGHSPTMPLAVRVEALTNRIAFFCNELGIPVSQEQGLLEIVARASLCLLHTEWYMRRHKDRPLQSVLRTPREPRAGLTHYSAKQIVHAVDIACVCYFKAVKCLQRSVALTMLLRRYGFPAEVVIGGRIIPAKFHAWVEIKGTVLNDKPYIPKLYMELDRC
jgi:prolyl oligopeptidase